MIIKLKYTNLFNGGQLQFRCSYTTVRRRRGTGLIAFVLQIRLWKKKAAYYSWNLLIIPMEIDDLIIELFWFT